MTGETESLSSNCSSRPPTPFSRPVTAAIIARPKVREDINVIGPPCKDDNARSTTSKNKLCLINNEEDISVYIFENLPFSVMVSLKKVTRAFLHGETYKKYHN